MGPLPFPEERAFLETLIEDGSPLVILAVGLDEPRFKQLRSTALSLVRQGLAGIYGRPEDARDLPLAQAEAVILDPRSWDPQTVDILWMISTTEAGNALVGAPNEW